ncbi:Os08g0399400 [Oryza sativa Japonica Group]|uniref:Os08g0399400 protein n=1 Tax=Oryza sativa subsp. japonica TaxID=39947 RepID=A0A0N7KPT7_ORYSJ|nr:Os08g0399400 [Oryza sativa Japonica Group]
MALNSAEDTHNVLLPDPPSDQDHGFGEPFSSTSPSILEAVARASRHRCKTKVVKCSVLASASAASTGGHDAPRCPRTPPLPRSSSGS